MTDKQSAPRGRLKFLELRLHPSPDGQARVTTRMAWQGEEYVGEATGVATREGELRMGAQASLDTIHKVAAGVVEGELTGVKAVRAFDAWVVIAAVRARAQGRDYRLLGAKACEEDDLTRSAAIAVLDALNRVLEKVIN